MWGQAGPPGGTVNDLLTVNAQVLYAATSAGVFESANGGRSWSARNQGLPDFPATSVAGRPQQLFVSLDGGGVWRSRNGGDWEEINDGVGDLQTFHIETHPTDPEILFVATASNGVLFSDNSGDGWIRAGSGLVVGPYIDIAFSPANPDTVLALNASGALFESLDGGRNWASRLSLPAGFRRIRFDPHEPRTVYVTTTSGVFRRPAGATQFESISPLQGFVVLDYMIDPVDPQVHYAATRDAGMARSLDAGANWRLVGSGLPAGWALTLRPLPGESGVLLAGMSGTGMFRSIDQALTWSASFQGLNGANVRSLTADPTRSGVLYAGVEGGGLFKTTDGGDSWIESRDGLALRRPIALAVDPAEPDVLYAGAVSPTNSQSGQAARSLDGGRTWETLFTGRPVFDIAVHPTDRGTVYFGMDGGTQFFLEAGLLRTRDRGETFTPLVGVSGLLFGSNVTQVAVDPVNPNNLFVGAVAGGPFFAWSDDEGGRFPAPLGTPLIGSVEVDPNEPRRVFLGISASNISNGGVERSTDGGRTFARVNSGLPTSSDLLSFSSIEIDPRDGAIYAAGGRAVYKSVDGGDSWQEANSGLEGLVVRRLAVDGTEQGVVYAATVDHGVFRTLDGAESWQPTGTAALVITAQGVVGAADFLGGGVAPGEIISIFGDGIGPAIGVEAALDAATGGLPTSLAGVRVLFDDEPAPLFYTDSNQANCQVPYEIAGRNVVRIRVEFGSGVSSEVALPVRPSKPGIFRAILNQDGSENTPENPARRGEFAILFATGQGVTQPPIATGRPGPLQAPFPEPVLPVKATVDGREAEFNFAGLAPRLVGLLQVNLRVPLQTAAGARTVAVMVGNESGTQEALLHVAP